jgi:hypothetical protein
MDLMAWLQRWYVVATILSLLYFITAFLTFPSTLPNMKCSVNQSSLFRQYVCNFASLLQHGQPVSSSFCSGYLPKAWLLPATAISRQIIGLPAHSVVMVTDFHLMQYLIPALICKIPYDLGYINSASSIYGWLIDTVVQMIQRRIAGRTSPVLLVVFIFVIQGIPGLYLDPYTGYPDRNIPRFSPVVPSKDQKSASH